jgi:1,2-diacylglycerol 3-beta-glucosyltransferase
VTDLLLPLGLISAAWVEKVVAALMLAPWLFFLCCVLYLWLLLLSAIPGRSRVAALSPLRTRRDGGDCEPVTSADHPVSAALARLPRFVLLIPAHNEELVIDAALAALAGLDYPAAAYRTVVIADNCNDRTATIARARGAEVMERHDPAAVGKGYALAWAVERLTTAEQNRPSDRLTAADEPAYDAVVIIDADTLVAPNLLKVFAQKLLAGESAIQARYEVLNSTESWRTRLMSCALAMAHVVKPLGRERLSLSDGLKGNGMCFARRAVEGVRWSGESITEDIDYTIRLCRAGHRVAFAPETAVWAQMPTTAGQSASQRKRWEGGRYQLMFQVAPWLVVESVRQRSRVLFDRAVELVIPPFAEMFAAPCVLLCGSLIALRAVHSPTYAVLSAAWIAILLLQAGYLIGGMWMAKIPLSVALTALYAPGYILWKFGLYGAMLVNRSAGGWKRTERRRLDA